MDSMLGECRAEIRRAWCVERKTSYLGQALTRACPRTGILSGRTIKVKKNGHDRQKTLIMAKSVSYNFCDQTKS